jgi:predicted nucleic acid-binding protein
VIGVDTSFLVGLAVREHPAHRACWKLFEKEILYHRAGVRRLATTDWRGFERYGV